MPDRGGKRTGGGQHEHTAVGNFIQELGTRKQRSLGAMVIRRGDWNYPALLERNKKKRAKKRAEEQRKKKQRAVARLVTEAVKKEQALKKKELSAQMAIANSFMRDAREARKKLKDTQADLARAEAAFAKWKAKAKEETSGRFAAEWEVRGWEEWYKRVRARASDKDKKKIQWLGRPWPPYGLPLGLA